MHLTDDEILELNELCNAVVDGMLNDAQRARLSAWLLASEAARQYYVRAVGMSASLHEYASEMHAEAPKKRIIPVSWRIFYWAGGSMAAAAAIAIALWVGLGTPKAEAPAVAPKLTTFVARLTASKNAEWTSKGTPAPGGLVRKGQRLELTSGYAEVTFDSGAQLVLEGPTLLTVNSAWDSTLGSGTVKASVPPQAIGFRVSNASVEVTDLGTEFSMMADAHSGATEVLVLKGAVEAAPHGQGDPQTILLREKESRRFERSGVTLVRDSEEKFAQLASAPELDRLLGNFRYAHWAFDQTSDRWAGNYFSPQPLAVPVAFNHSANDATQARAPGRWHQALHLDGLSYATTSFPGISQLAPHTISFWVKVPDDAPLSNAYAMVSWRAGTPKLSYRPVHLSWNRNPTEGALGALRTDFSGGCAIGTTSLRDGRWHHLAVVLTPSEDAAVPMQIKQYVDGRLESSTIIPGKVRSQASQANQAMDDLIWLGCRLGGSGPRQERFRGDIDELYVVDRELEPQEIVQLLTDNRLGGTPASALVATH